MNGQDCVRWDVSRPDTLAKTLLDRGDLIVDAQAGTIIRARTGKRAEILDKRTGYGRVTVYTKPVTFAMAHRIVWIAAHGLMPAKLHINHINRHPWDNRIDNLELVAPKGNIRHSFGYWYDIADPAWLHRLDHGEQAPDTIDPYGMAKPWAALQGTA